MTPSYPAPAPHGPDRVTPEVLAWVEQRVSSWGRRLRLQAADLDDARENAVLAVVRALRHYDPAHVAGPADRSLDALLELVVFRSLCDFRRSGQRLARHFDASADVNRILEDEAAGRCGARPLVSAEEGPAEAAGRHEEEALLAAAVHVLAPEEYRLYESCLSGESLAGIARRLYVTVKVARGRLPKLWEKLSAAVGGLAGGGRGPAGRSK